MSIYTRSYMRHEDRRADMPFDMVKWILIVLGGAYVLQKVVEVFIGGATANQILSFFWLSDASLRRGLIYTPVTYALLHGGLLHILFNGLGLYFAGRALQARLGPARILELFLYSVIAGGLAWLLINAVLGRGGSPLVGASAGCFGFLSLFALFYWNETIRFFFWFIPVSLRGQQIFFILLGLQGFFFLFGELAPDNRGSQVAYSAHLAGFAVGYLYFKVLQHRSSLWDLIGSGRGSPRRARRTSRREATKSALGNYSINLKTRPAPEVRAEVDRILDKINTEGFGALSDDEKRTLDKAKDNLR